MWGDGANDCKALKSADIGLSLSEAEASIAAPFTSLKSNISPLITLLSEGKSSLWVTFQLFQMIFLCAVIQTSGVFIMYYLNTDFSDIQFWYIDILILFPLSFFIAMTHPPKKLTHKVPFSSLFCFPVLLSISWQCILHISMMAAMLWVLNHQDWFFPILVDVDEDLDVSYENSTLFLFSNLQYISTFFAYNVSKPFMKPMYTNLTLTISIIVTLGISYYIILEPSDDIKDLLDLTYFPYEFRYILIIGTIIDFLLSFLLEKVLIKAFSDCWEKRKVHPKGYI